jgi:hypothetical protein
MKALLTFSILLSCGLATQAQTNPCADPHAPRVGFFNISSTTKTPPDITARLQQVGPLIDALERQFYASCVVKDVSIFDDPKNYPTLNGSLLLVISAMPSLKRRGFVAVSIEFSMVKGPDVMERMPVTTCPVLLEPDDTESELNVKAQGCLVRYNGMVDGMSKRNTGH